MRPKTLPTYYYLDHFVEFLSYIKGPCSALLTAEHIDWIEKFNSLPKPQQCLVARVANRKYPLIALQSLHYPEIPEWQSNAMELIEQGWLNNIDASQLTPALPLFTKPELLELLKSNQCADVKVSMPKSKLVDLSVAEITYSKFIKSELYRQYVHRNFNQILSYFLFLFFGHTKGTLSQFSMRDLGIMRTRADSVNATARFSFLDEAQSAFWHAQWRDQLRAQESELHGKPNLEQLPEAIGSLADKYRNDCLYQLGKAHLETNKAYAMAALALSTSDSAQEKWIRESYKDGDKEKVKAHLEEIIENPQSEELAIFAQDFIARKYGQKRTSKLTDMLNNAQLTLLIDEQYINQVENGVVDNYRRSDVRAVRTENTLWLTLFGLVFWDIIYERDARTLSNEFDIRPNVLIENRLYLDHQVLVEEVLQRLSSVEKAKNFLLQQVTSHHGKISTLLHWHAHLLDNIFLMLEHSPIEYCVELLRFMAKDFKSFKDGFPDIMVIEQGNLRFEEIKAPGDQLRRNQLVSLNKLQEVGYQVQITRVEWFRDPMQPYVVVDIETTGGRAGNHRITEIGMVKRINGESVAEWQSLINPQRHIPSQITSLTGIDDAMVADAPVFSDVADSVEEFTQGCIFVAHNVNFDYGFFKAEFERLDRFYRRPKLCTVREMRKAFPGLRSYSLANLTDYFGIEMQRHHRAMSDAMAAAELLDLSQKARLNKQNQ